MKPKPQQSPHRHALCALTAPALAVLVLAVASPAGAYCRTTTCDPLSEDCEVDANGCPTLGYPLHWPDGCVSYTVNEEASPLHEIPYEVAAGLAERATQTWTEAECENGEHPSLAVFATNSTPLDEATFSLTEGNLNLVIFRDDNWPYARDGRVLAFTTINYNKQNGEILDADIELNSEFARLTAGNATVIDDLESVLTHEFGHFFGLSHVPDPNATMFLSYEPGETLKRSLSRDDIAGICAAYPPGSNPGADRRDCDSAPHNGFPGDCCPETQGGCAVAALAPTETKWMAWSLLLALGLGVRLRARRRATNAQPVSTEADSRAPRA